MQTETLIYSEGDQELEGTLVFDESSTAKRPGVLVSHAWGGANEFTAAKAQALSQLGYVGLALDVYGVGRRGSNPEENMSLMQPFLDDRRLLRRRMTAALAALRGHHLVDTKRVAAIGFCFGGLCVLDLARSGADVRGVVSFHGLLAPATGLKTEPIQAKVLALHGHEDPLVSDEELQAFTGEMTSAGADWQLHQYGSTMHAFTNPAASDPASGMQYSQTAERRSWASMESFLQEVLL